MTTEPTADVDEPALSYERARDELVEVVRQLEAGGATLEDSLRLWERGEELARVCQSWLDGARARLAAAASPEAADEVEDLDQEMGDDEVGDGELDDEDEEP